MAGPRIAARAMCLAVVLWAASPARAGVNYQGQASASGNRTTSLRLPAIGTFTMPAVPAGYMTVSIAISGSDYTVDRVTWIRADNASQALAEQSGRDTPDPPHCRVEIWGTENPLPGSGSLLVQVTAQGGVPAPDLYATVIAYSNVVSVSTLGTCCMLVANSGSGTSPITKTVSGTSNGDYLVDSACAVWNDNDPTPSSPTVDLDANPLMIVRNVERGNNPDMYAFVSNSGPAPVDRPATGARVMRWVQSGSRSWALTALILQGQDDAPALDAAAPVDTAPPVDAPAVSPDAAPDHAPSPPDAGPIPSPDSAPPPPVDASPSSPDAVIPPYDAVIPSYDSVIQSADAPIPADAPISLDTALRPDGPPPPLSDAEPPAPPASQARVDVNLAVGCACHPGGRPSGGGLTTLLVAAALLLGRRLRT